MSGPWWPRPTALPSPKVNDIAGTPTSPPRPGATVVFRLTPLTSCNCGFQGYCEEQGAVGGAGLEDDLHDLRLDEENEQPPLILETD